MVAASPGTSHTKPARMSTRARKARVSLLDDRIDILDKNAAGSSPPKEVFRTVAAILALVRVSSPALTPSANSRISFT